MFVWHCHAPENVGWLFIINNGEYYKGISSTSLSYVANSDHADYLQRFSDSENVWRTISYWLASQCGGLPTKG